MRKGQFFSIDILIASLTFILLLVLISYAYDAANEKTQLIEIRNDLEFLAHQATSNLLFSEGNPSHWYNLTVGDFVPANISRLGLMTRQSWVLSFIKLKRLLELNNTRYNQTKQMMGIQGPGYEYYLTIQNRYGFSEYSGFFNSSAPGVIGYTYANDNENSYTSPNYGILAYFQEKGIAIDNYGSNYKSLLGNINKYQIVIFENPMLEEADLSAAEKAALQSFVGNGGMYLQKGFGKMIEIFSVQTNNVAHEDGLVVMTDPMLKDVSVGDYLTVEGGYRINKQGGGLVKVIEHTSGHMLAGHFQYGTGTVYYYPYSIGVVYNSTGGIKFNNTRAILNLPSADSSIFSIGINPGVSSINATEIVKVSRVVLIDDQGQLKQSVLDFYLWKKCNGAYCLE